VKRLSLRARILSGAVLWTVGLFAGSVLAGTWLMLRYRHYPFLLHGLAARHWALGLVFVLLCTVGGILYVRSGLSSFRQLRERLAAVHAGRQSRVQGRYPSEVQPLVDDLNALLEHREAAVRRAVAKAGDLAHGLKTPLAVLAQEAERMQAAGHVEVASILGEQIERMRRQIDYHLAQARAAASGATPGARCAVRESADGLARTLHRLHAARGVAIEVTVDPSHVVRVQREDLDEMLGNLLDNACRWARTRVGVTSVIDDGVIAIDVDDDGPGVQPSMRDVVLQRGVRADEVSPGSGLGLAIVRDLSDLYGGSITLEGSPAGGLRARLELPSAA
jgi:signal transduction histidine kinase